MCNKHQPVLCREVVDGLALRSGGIYLDATYGGGGHSRAVLQKLSAGSQLYAIDRDPRVAAGALQLLPADHFCCISFARLVEATDAFGITGRVDGLLLDLGISSLQLDDPARGFSFMNDSPLDMRMNQSSGESAAEWLNRAHRSDIAEVLRDYGEEPRARLIAAEIVSERKKQPIVTTGQLAGLVARIVPRNFRRHPATRCFQAVRIHINDELGALRQALDQSLQVLAVGGRLAVIGFHSLEIRMVKRFISDHSRDHLPADLPLPAALLPRPKLRPAGSSILPGADEIRSNRRARSAVLRFAERLADE